jgi:acyl-CoA thioesterase I
VTSELRLDRPLDILAIGSSSTTGVGASRPDLAYPARLQAELREGLAGKEVTVVNAGVSGETADATVARLEEAVRGGGVDLVLWQVGTNDAVRGGDEGRFRELLGRGIRAVRDAGVDLILVDQQYYPTIKDPARYERFVGLVAAVAAEFQVPVFSRYALMKAWGARDAAHLRGMLAEDGFHLGDGGYRCMAQVLRDEIVARAAPNPDATVVAARPRRR